MRRTWSNQVTGVSRRPAGQSNGTGSLSATLVSDRAFPAVVAELDRSPMHYLRSLIALTVLCISLAAVSADAPAMNTNRFHSPTAGFAVSKPADWQFASMEQVATNRAIARLKDKELEAQI